VFTNFNDKKEKEQRKKIKAEGMFGKYVIFQK
jgi:hypothetical protein